MLGIRCTGEWTVAQSDRTVELNLQHTSRAVLPVPRIAMWLRGPPVPTTTRLHGRSRIPELAQHLPAACHTCTPLLTPSGGAASIGPLPELLRCRSRQQSSTAWCSLVGSLLCGVERMERAIKPMTTQLDRYIQPTSAFGCLADCVHFLDEQILSHAPLSIATAFGCTRVSTRTLMHMPPCNRHGTAPQV